MKDKLPVDDLNARTKRFALSIIGHYANLPKNEVAAVMGHQLLRSGTSAGALYRQASRAHSDTEFISKLEVALQQLEETRYWLELLVESDHSTPHQIDPLHQESTELIAILTTILRNRKRALQ